MKVCLLYENREWVKGETYYDSASIVQDLGLNTMFAVASQEITYENGAVKQVEKPDQFLAETMRSVMMVPLTTEEEIRYRQESVEDGLQHEEMTRELYRISSDVVLRWNDLGRGYREKMKLGSPIMRLTADIRVLHMFCEALTEIRSLLRKEEFISRGFKALREELDVAFSEEREASVRKILDDISFYVHGLEHKEDENHDTVVKPRIVFECGLEDGLKFSSMKLLDISSQNVRFFRRGSTRDKLQKFLNGRIPDSFSVTEDERILEQTHQLEFESVSYVMRLTKNFTREFQTFFDQLRLQSAFCLAAVQLRHQLNRLGMTWCYPQVCDRRDLEFEELREFIMGLQQRVNVIGNTCSLLQKDLLIVTGANQGGKSTFLRSIGIAQVMMQSGLPVVAKSYRSGIFPRIFVHFTRREDSEMNSGRLDEELRRMNGIIEQIGDGSLILLNESFATTTEKEGSVIAYDITKALKEAGVRILTVTHLLSFARRVHEETAGHPEAGVEFLSAERKPDGTRTYHMIYGQPELTSFGLDLYDSIVGGY
ncbi:MAG: hypothetical protein J5649_10590 [Lachnospiraceae bacterium]|nr:hypothetical protein [Lachnospiraceae bacterium]